MELTDKEVLQKAIEIAMENGYKEPFMYGMCSDFSLDKFQVFKLYFSHDFARAFFKYKEPTKLIGQIYKKSYYHDFELHLMKMVIEENPIDYLRKFIAQETKK